MARRTTADDKAERPKGSGSIRPIGERPKPGRSGRWELRVNLSPDPVTGKRRQRSKSFTGTEKQANQALGSLIADTSAERSPATDATFGHLLTTWLERCERNLAPSTVVGYRRIVDDLWMPKLGHVPLSQLETRHLQAVLDWDHSRKVKRGKTETPVTASTVLRHWAVARKALNDAVRMGWIPSSPGERGRVLLPSRRGGRKADLPKEDLLKILLAADEMDPALGLILRAATVSGARRSELAGLRWRDIDWDRNRIEFHQGVVILANPKRREGDPKRRARKVIVTDTKSHQSRPVTVDPDSMELLRLLRAYVEEVARVMAPGKLTRDSFVFSREPDGSKPLRPDWLSTAFKKAARLAGHPEAHLHQLRHLSASVMLSHGIPTSVASARLGHAEETTTITFYSRAIQSDEAAAAVIASVLFPPLPKPGAPAVELPEAEAG
jgi:integrase